MKLTWFGDPQKFIDIIAFYTFATYFNQWLLLFLAVRTNPFGLTLLHFTAHLSRNTNAFAVKPFFTLITTNHETVVMWCATNAPKAVTHQALNEKRKEKKRRKKPKSEWKWGNWIKKCNNKMKRENKFATKVRLKTNEQVWLEMLIKNVSDFVRINVNIVTVIWFIIISFHFILIQFKYIYSNKTDEIKFIHECKKITLDFVDKKKIKFLVYISNHICFNYKLHNRKELYKKSRGQWRYFFLRKKNKSQQKNNCLV